jgi:hypothetical protein
MLRVAGDPKKKRGCGDSGSINAFSKKSSNLKSGGREPGVKNEGL